jgi:hypothetical protein
MTEEAPVCAGALEPSEPAAVPTIGMGIGAAAGPLLFGATSDSNRSPQGLLTARAVGSDRSGASQTPKAAAEDALGDKVSTAAAGSGVGSQSSASQLQKEWADTASSAKTSGTLKA